MKTVLLVFSYLMANHFNEHALTWKKEIGFIHNRVDIGDNPGKHKGSPLLVPDGNYNLDQILKELIDNSDGLEDDIIEFISDIFSNGS